MENKKGHPSNPPSNVAKFGGYDPDKYILAKVSPTVRTNESLTPGRPPCLTQMTVGKYLVPTTYELDEVQPKPTIDELPDAVKEEMVKKDKAFWVDKPGANAYTLHDAYYNYGMTTEQVKPTPQSVFPRSYQYDLDCVMFRRLHACDELNVPPSERKKTLPPHCRDCTHLNIRAYTPFQLTWLQDETGKRWRYYPNLTANLTTEQIRTSMDTVGRPFQNEACNWYYENYPPVKYEGILRKFSK